MIKLKNKKCIKKLANNSFKANKLRNSFSIFAIVLTTVMFTSLIAIGMNLKESLEETTMRQVGTSAHCGFKYLSEEEYELIKKHNSIKDVQFSVILGIAENRELKKHPTEIRYGTEGEAEFMFSKPTVGNMPVSENEIATDTIVLDRLGIPHNIGEKIQISYSLNGEFINDTFVLSGYWEGDEVTPASNMWVSKEYLSDKLENYSSLKDNDMIGTINADVMFKNSIDIETKAIKVIQESGYNTDEIEYGVNWAYISSSDKINISSILVMVCGIILIGLCGYLIIYNIFFISISRDIRFYGLLKTIGTSSKQIKTIIISQSLNLCLIGIPIGAILGYFIGIWVTPMVLNQTSASINKISVNPMIFIFSAIFVLLTVLISLRKPSKIAGQVSPIEALRNTEHNSKSILKIKSKKGRKIAIMAISNVFRNKKKTFITTVSLSLSLIILNSTYSLSKSFNMDAYLSNVITSDFIIADSSYFNVNLGYNYEETITEDFISNLKANKGITEIGDVRFSETFHPTDNNFRENILKIIQNNPNEFQGGYGDVIKISSEEESILTHTYGLDKTIVEQLKVIQGEADYEKLKTGKYIIVSTFSESIMENYYNIGDKVKIDYGNGKINEYEVLAIANLDYNLTARHDHTLSLNFFTSKEDFILNNGNISPMCTMLNVEDEFENSIEKYLNDYCENINQDMSYESRAKYRAEFKGLQTTFITIGLLLSFIMASIGIMNFVNSMGTSIISRKRELAMLQSIGMTKKQLNKMLVFEGLTYAVLTSMLSFTVGVAISYLIVMALASSMWFLQFNFTIIPIVISLAIFFVLAIIVPIYSYKLISKSSIVERLREFE